MILYTVDEEHPRVTTVAIFRKEERAVEYCEWLRSRFHDNNFMVTQMETLDLDPFEEVFNG